jgi:predicted ATP-grasp superfamily ATP-dependent carboligase
MKPAEIVYQLRELQDTWRRNNFNLNEGQQVTYDKLLQLRRQRVRFFYDNNLVFKGSKAAWDKEQAEEAAQVAASQVEQSEEN